MSLSASAIRTWRHEPWTMVADIFDQNGPRVTLDAWQMNALKAVVAGENA